MVLWWCCVVFVVYTFYVLCYVDAYAVMLMSCCCYVMLCYVDDVDDVLMLDDVDDDVLMLDGDDELFFFV